MRYPPIFIAPKPHLNAHNRQDIP